MSTTAQMPVCERFTTKGVQGVVESRNETNQGLLETLTVDFYVVSISASRSRFQATELVASDKI